MFCGRNYGYNNYYRHRHECNAWRTMWKLQIYQLSTWNERRWKNPHPATYRWQNGWIETICKNTLTISNIIRVVEKWDVQCSFKMQALIWSRIWQKFNIIMLSQCRGWTENEWFPYIADVNICRVTVRLLLLLQSCSVFHISILATEFKNSLLTIQSHAVADDGCSSAYKNNRYNKDFLL